MWDRKISSYKWIHLSDFEWLFNATLTADALFMGIHVHPGITIYRIQYAAGECEV